MVKAILILPFNATVTVPALLLWLTRPVTVASVDTLRFWGAFGLLVLGLFLFVSTVRLFARIGKGSLAPWEPPKRLVVAGPYRYLRHPMITGVTCTLMAETLLFGSWPLSAWTAMFALLNAFYLPLKEETDLIGRFGDDYRVYRRHVPRWLPRLTPWVPPSTGDGDGA